MTMVEPRARSRAHSKRLPTLMRDYAALAPTEVLRAETRSWPSSRHGIPANLPQPRWLQSRMLGAGRLGLSVRRRRRPRRVANQSVPHAHHLELSTVVSVACARAWTRSLASSRQCVAKRCSLGTVSEESCALMAAPAVVPQTRRARRPALAQAVVP